TAPLRPLLFEGPLPADGLHQPLLTEPWRFERGFVERVAVRTEPFRERGADLFRLAPVRWAWFAFNADEGGDVYGTWHARLARCPLLARLKTLDLSGHHFDAPASGTHRLLRSPHLARLERLYLRYGFGLDDVGFLDPATVRLLASSTTLPCLRLLDLA